MFDQNQILLTALLKIQEAPLVPGEGICYNVEMATFNVQGADDLAISQRMKAAFPEWPEFSGDYHYPVPNGDCDPIATFHGTDLLWEGAYGESRKSLLAFLIAELQRDSE